jgi:flagellar biosynthesis protein FlhA
MSTAMPPPNSRLPRSELLMSLGLLGVLAVFLVPLPPVLLDLLLAFNIGVTILLMLVTLSVRQPLEFSIFPSLLLILTLFRLALNVATARLVLLKGDAGHIVSAFGKFVAGDNLIVGLVIFLILVIIQFVVITRGAGRISEVAARFVLDAMPGKQMAIDAEMNSGLINETEARARRQALVRESEFYGTMDGASKFVRGDAIAAVIITAVNLLGGIILAVTRGVPIATAARTYSVLTIGDGLVTQMPALIIATTAGVLVTKSTSQSNLGQEIGVQFTGSAGPLRLGGIILLGMALLPGFPVLPFVLLGAGLLLGARRLTQQKATPTSPTDEKSGATPKPPAEVTAEDFLQQDRVGLEIGARLIPFVDPARGPGLVDRVSGLRRDLAKQSGLWMPAVRIRDNIALEAEAYRVLVSGREVARGTIRSGRWLAIDSGTGQGVLEGEPTREPAFGLPARWIAEGDRARAEMGGYTVVDSLTVLVTHLGELVRRHAHELLSREDLKSLVDKVRESSPAVVDELIPNVLTMGALHRVLVLLLEERVPVSNLTRILESLANHAPTTKDAAELTERVRTDIGRSICDRFRDEQGRMRALVLDPRLEVELRRGIQNGQLAVDPARVEQLVLKLATEMRKAAAGGRDVALLCDTALRRLLRHTLARSLGDLAVVAYQEVPSDLLLEPISFVRPEDLGAPTAQAKAA